MQGRLGRGVCSRSRPAAWPVLFGLCLIATSQGFSAERWADRRVVAPFICRADFSLAELNGLIDDLARLQHDLGEALEFPPADEWIEVYLFHDQGTYRRYLGLHFPHVPFRRALYVKRDGPGIVLAYRSGELEVDLRHECTHALLHAALPLVPLWLDEGLAEYFEVSPGNRGFGSPYLSAVRWKARLGMVPKMENLERKRDLAAMGGSQYRDAWAWVHFMLHGPPEVHDEMLRFLADLKAGSPPGTLSSRLSQRVPDLKRRFSTHFRGWKQ